MTTPLSKTVEPTVSDSLPFSPDSIGSSLNAPRVLFLDHTGALGGAELYLLDLVRQYPGDCRVLLFDDGPFATRLENENISTRVLQGSSQLLNVRKDGGIGTALTASLGLLQLVGPVAREAQNADVIFANSQKAAIVASLAGHWARRPVVWSLHDILTADHFSRLNRWAAVTAANWGVTHLLANSKATEDAFKTSGGRTPSTVVYNGIDADDFPPLAPDRIQSLRMELDVPLNVPVAGVFSRLAPWKGQAVLLQALPAVPDLHALFVGDALFDGDTQYVDELKSLARDLGVVDRVHFAGFRSDIPALMQAVDVVAHTSTSPEPFGRVIVEGMLAKRPVVATRAGGAMEIVTHGRTGLLVSAGDASELGRALSHLLSHPEAAERMAAAGHADARERFALDGMVQSISDLLRRVVDEETELNPK